MTVASLSRTLFLLGLVAAMLAGPPSAAAAPKNAVCWTNDELEPKVDAAFAVRLPRPSYFYDPECPDLRDLVPYPPCASGRMALAYYRARAAEASCREPPTVVAQLSKVTGAEAFDFGEAFYFGGYQRPYASYVTKDLRVAFVYYHKAQDAAALSALGYMYQSGEGTERDRVRAREAYGEAIRLGGMTTVALAIARMAPHQLGRIYEDGEGVARDDQAAFRHYQTGTKWGEPWAAYRLALFYAQGRGTQQNLGLAITILETIVQRERLRRDQTVVQAAAEAARKVREAQQKPPSTGSIKIAPLDCNYVVKERDRADGFKLVCEQPVKY
jgi:TPR repeat protein